MGVGGRCAMTFVSYIIYSYGWLGGGVKGAGEGGKYYDPREEEVTPHYCHAGGGERRDGK